MNKWEKELAAGQMMRWPFGVQGRSSKRPQHGHQQRHSFLLSIRAVNTDISVPDLDEPSMARGDQPGSFSLSICVVNADISVPDLDEPSIASDDHPGTAVLLDRNRIVQTHAPVPDPDDPIMTCGDQQGHGLLIGMEGHTANGNGTEKNKGHTHCK
eukprot:1160360-Pelagomonas_calceolata.AAC.4